MTSYDSEIIVVSGLPRSGTSLMMQMLAGAGMSIVTDQIRTADKDNPRGYFEFEKVKMLKTDPCWLSEVRGKVIKIVSQLLYDLPTTERYRILFMERDLDEVILSQEKMLERLGRTGAPREKLRESFDIHLSRIRAWLARQPNLAVHYVGYKALLMEPQMEVQRVVEFLGGLPDVTGLIEAIDPRLYRNRSTGEADL